MHVIAGKAICFLEAHAARVPSQYQTRVIAMRKHSREAWQQRVAGSSQEARTRHLLLVDVFAKGVRGKEAEIALDKANITVNKNGIPFDINPP